MKQTSNYQLNQWDAQDRILREDFNDDNEKIDAALAEIKAAGAYVKLKEVTLSVPANRIDVDLSDVDFREYERLFIYCSLPNESNPRYTVRLDNIADSCYSGGSSAGICNHCGEFSPNGELQSLELAASANRSLVISRVAGDGGGGVTYNAITSERWRFGETGPNSINFTHSTNFLTGSYVRVYGLRR